MDALYISAAGAKQTMLAQAIHANNLANAKTTGFRADLFNANQVALFNEEIPSQVYATSAEAVSDFTPGSIITTGRELDVAIQGPGWIAVQSPSGKEAYTRAGSLQLNANGQLMTAAGHPVLGNGSIIAIPPAEKITVGVDGTISVRPIGQQANALATIDRIKLVNPDKSLLKKGDDGLFYMPNQEPATADASVRLVSGAVEGSNVNAVGELIDMIALARQFEMQMKIMQETKSTEESLAQLLQL